jgi:riboflavin kinase/FMN adenylyltransferase
MRIVRELTSYAPEATAVALGVFDGVHLAHQAILRTAIEAARRHRLESVACTFDPHPAEVLQPQRSSAAIATLGDRLDLIAATGVGVTVVLPFTPALAQMEPEAFVEDILLGRLHAREVVVGFNHTFGRGARGDPKLLQDLAGRLGFGAHVVPPLLVDGVAVSSSAIRASLREGDLERANRMLGRPYLIGGDVVSGAGRGRTLGFPTANVRPDRQVLVAPGVYACRVDVGPDAHRAVVNVGVRPTFGEATLVIEAYLLDFQGTLYDRSVRVAFLARLREERRFPSVDALRDQILRDVADARERLGKVGFTS